ncbi:hypothetical protein GYMLUDRAFT_398589 [Collybiopsis luxurians FD-317 M1]|nr:hypothetical protein GYMLUDRAFT_398589 [Collybiopsis luxurians FD-317 M1]
MIVVETIVIPCIFPLVSIFTCILVQTYILHIFTSTVLSVSSRIGSCSAWLWLFYFDQSPLIRFFFCHTYLHMPLYFVRW